LSQYDRLLIDEAQDLSPVMLACLEEYRGSVTIVGDGYQSIYSFRHALDALPRVHADGHFLLSKSFRFGEEIAEFISSYMRSVVDPSFRMVGNEEIRSRISIGEHYIRDQATILARTNFELVRLAVGYMRSGKAFVFERDVSYILQRIYDLWQISCGRRKLVRDKMLKMFISIDDVRRFAQTSSNASLIASILVIETYKNEMPDLIYDLQEHIEEAKELPSGGITLSTVHSYKGQEADRVYIASDLHRNIDRAVSSGDSGSEECRVFYVAASRARRHLILHGCFGEALYAGWDSWVARRVTKDRSPFWNKM